MSNWTAEEVSATMQQLLKETVKDPDFRQLCLDDPNLAVQRISGKEVPIDYKIQFVDKGNYNMVLVLPDPVEDSSSLSDAELEQVAGGKPSSVCLVSCGASCAYSCLCISIPTVTGA